MIGIPAQIEPGNEGSHEGNLLDTTSEPTIIVADREPPDRVIAANRLGYSTGSGELHAYVGVPRPLGGEGPLVRHVD